MLLLLLRVVVLLDGLVDHQRYPQNELGHGNGECESTPHIKVR